MARSAIPDFYKLQPNGEEWPEYQYQPFPRYVGLDAEGNALIADNEEDAQRLAEIAAFPKNMGKDKNGKDVIAQSDRDLQFFKSRVVTPPEDPAVIAKREADRLAAIAETERKAKAYDEMMAAQGASKEPADSVPAENALTAPTGLKKSKAA